MKVCFIWDRAQIRQKKVPQGKKEMVLVSSLHRVFSSPFSLRMWEVLPLE